MSKNCKKKLRGERTGRGVHGAGRPAPIVGQLAAAGSDMSMRVSNGVGGMAAGSGSGRGMRRGGRGACGVVGGRQLGVGTSGQRGTMRVGGQRVTGRTGLTILPVGGLTIGPCQS